MPRYDVPVQTDFADSVVLMSNAVGSYLLRADGLQIGNILRRGDQWEIRLESPVPHSPLLAPTFPEAVEAALCIANVFCAKGAFEDRL